MRRFDLGDNARRQPRNLYRATRFLTRSEERPEGCYCRLGEDQRLALEGVLWKHCAHPKRISISSNMGRRSGITDSP